MVLTYLGRGTLRGLKETAYLTAVNTAVLRRCLLSSQWPRTTRRVLKHQIYFSGVQACTYVSVLAILFGSSLTLQSQYLLQTTGKSEMFGSFMVAALIREIAPLTVNTVVLIRSGTAIATELATMSVGGEVRVLEAQGIDPLHYLVIPRVVGFVISVLCLTVLFLFVALTFGYASSFLLEITAESPLAFIQRVLSSLSPWDVSVTFLKCALPAMAAVSICCVHGLTSGESITDIPKVVTQALSWSIMALFSASVVISLFAFLVQ